MSSLLNTTESVCPVCLTKLMAYITADNEGVFLEKRCAEHGSFKTIIWRGSRTSYDDWIRDAGPRGRSHPSGPHHPWERGCPFDCGLCPEHKNETCSAALMVTSRCNLNCPVCFTRDSQEPLHEPSLDRLGHALRFYRDTSGKPFPLEICGGEPTVRDDLTDIVAMAGNMGFDHIQINTNGIRLAQDAELAERLKAAGATVIYLGFDGADDTPYLATTGKGLFAIKQRAVENCTRAGLAVVLVPVLVPGLNIDHIGRIIQMAKNWVPGVKGVFFQPISYFGAYPGTPSNQNRITLPEVLTALNEQTRGEIKETDFMPPGCEHPLCSFNGVFLLDRNGRLKSVVKRTARTNNDGAADRVRNLTTKQWRANPAPILTVGGMLFQDAWTLDIARLKRCIIHILAQDGGLIPLCAKYLTSRDGQRLHPGMA
jgi:7,8-dihydro-6-hydroxymethylpterin dimethyltransferase